MQRDVTGDVLLAMILFAIVLVLAHGWFSEKDRECYLYLGKSNICMASKKAKSATQAEAYNAIDAYLEKIRYYDDLLNEMRKSMPERNGREMADWMKSNPNFEKYDGIVHDGKAVFESVKVLYKNRNYQGVVDALKTSIDNADAGAAGGERENPGPESH